MPPKVKVSREKIVDAALAIVREYGIDALNARAVALRLSCSTQPVFSNYPSMAELKTDLKHTAYALFCDSIARVINEGKYPIYKSSGMGYITFAKQEKELFKLLFMSEIDASQEQLTDFGVTIKYVAEKLGISDDDAKLFHCEMWMCVHGMASLVATSKDDISEELCSEMLTDIYNGLILRFSEKSKKNKVSCEDKK